MDKTEAITAVLDILHIRYQEDTVLYKALEDLYSCGLQDGYRDGYDSAVDDCAHE